MQLLLMLNPYSRFLGLFSFWGFKSLGEYEYDRVNQSYEKGFIAQFLLLAMGVSLSFSLSLIYNTKNTVTLWSLSLSFSVGL